MVDNKKYLNIISKLMNEETINSDINISYDKLFDYIHGEFIKALDDGCYTANAEVIKKLDKILNQYTIFNAINELVEKQIVAIRGELNQIINALFHGILDSCKWVKNNTNLPLIIIPCKEQNGVYALTYMNKLIALDSEEYNLITKEFYKENIEIKKLLKCFVTYISCEYENLSFVLLPQYMDNSNDVYKKLKNLYRHEYLFVDKGDVWVKSIKKLPRDKIAILNGTERAVSVKEIFGRNIRIIDYASFREMCKSIDYPIINHSIKSEILNVLLDIEEFYTRELNSISSIIERLTNDSFMLEEGEVKAQVTSYKNKLLDYKDKLQNGKKNFLHAKNYSLEIAEEYEKFFSKILMYDLPSDVVKERYIEILLEIFFKYIKSESKDGIEQTLLKLRKAHYNYLEACKAYYDHLQGEDIHDGLLQRIHLFPNERWEIAKIKIALCKELKYKYDDLIALIEYIGIHLDDGVEFFLLAKKQLDMKQYNRAKKNFEIALEYNYSEAGKELIDLAVKCPECKIDIDELAEKLVPEANYYIGCQSFHIAGKYKKGIVNIKMAASKEHIDAIVKIADIHFKECKKISWQNMQNESNRHKVNNVIRMYEFLEKRSRDNGRDENIYRFRIGKMYCKLADYSRAFEYLKNIKMPEALYECARICQYGNGVAKNLKMALMYYEQIEGEYSDSAIQLDKVRKAIARDEEVKNNSSQTYSSITRHVSSSSDYCFITTAACFALSAEKDCDELNELRWFRDTYILNHVSKGKDLIEEYYRIGPKVVAHIDADWNPYAIYEELWNDYIFPSCTFIKNMMWEKALGKYIDMVKHMCEKYAIPVKAEIREQYCINVKSAEK